MTCLVQMLARLQAVTDNDYSPSPQLFWLAMQWTPYTKGYSLQVLCEWVSGKVTAEETLHKYECHAAHGILQV